MTKDKSAEKDYLDQLIEEFCRDPDAAKIWMESEARLTAALQEKLQSSRMNSSEGPSHD